MKSQKTMTILTLKGTLVPVVEREGVDHNDTKRASDRRVTVSRPGRHLPRANHRAHRLFLRPPPPASLLHFPLNTSFLMTAVNQYPIPPATADLATTWAFLEEGVDHIMTKLHTGVSYTKYMNLYTVSYNYCTSSKMHSTSSHEQSVAGRSLFLFTFQPRSANIPLQVAPI